MADETIDLDLTDEELARYSRYAHEAGLSLNEFIIRAVYSYLIKIQDEELRDLRRRMDKARGLLEEALGQAPEES